MSGFFFFWGGGRSLVPTRWEHVVMRGWTGVSVSQWGGQAEIRCQMAKQANFKQRGRVLSASSCVFGRCSVRDVSRCSPSWASAEVRVAGWRWDAAGRAVKLLLGSLRYKQRPLAAVCGRAWSASAHLMASWQYINQSLTAWRHILNRKTVNYYLHQRCSIKVQQVLS